MAEISALAIAVAGAGAALSVVDVADFQAALSALAAVDAELAVEPQAHSSSDRDFAVGGAQSSVGSNFGLSAHSGQTGEDAFGHLSDTIPNFAPQSGTPAFLVAKGRIPTRLHLDFAESHGVPPTDADLQS